MLSEVFPIFYPFVLGTVRYGSVRCDIAQQRTEMKPLCLSVSPMRTLRLMSNGPMNEKWAASWHITKWCY